MWLSLRYIVLRIHISFDLVAIGGSFLANLNLIKVSKVSHQCPRNFMLVRFAVSMTKCKLYKNWNIQTIFLLNYTF